MPFKKTKILIAKPGLDGHDKGAKIVALALRDAGFEVIYTGLHQGLDQIAERAIRESADVIGLSIMSGAHIPICEKLLKIMEAKDMLHIHVVVGGVIPARDVERLKATGIKGIFPNGHPFDEIIASIRAISETKQ